VRFIELSPYLANEKMNARGEPPAKGIVTGRCQSDKYFSVAEAGWRNFGRAVAKS
jgi:hypothetical protein